MLKFRSDKATRICKYFLNEINYWYYTCALTMIYTCEKQNEWFSTRIWQTDNYKRLPNWAHEQIRAARTVYDLFFEKNLVWTHVLDGERIWCDDPKTKGRAIDISNQMQNTSDFAFAVKIITDKQRIVFVPRTEIIRVKDIETGRLNSVDIDRIIDPHRNPCKREFMTVDWLKKQLVVIQPQPH